MLNHAIDGAPVGQTSKVAVVNKEIYHELAREVGVVFYRFLRIVAVGSIELDTTLMTPLQGCLEELALTTSPKDQTMPIGNEHLEGLYSEGALGTYLRIAVLNDCSI